MNIINAYKRRQEIAFRYGLWLALAGTFLIVLWDSLDSYKHIMTFIDNDIYLVAFFIAGMLTARKVGLVKHAGLAGRWAAFFSVLFGLAYEVIVYLFQFVAFHAVPKFITDVDFSVAPILMILMLVALMILVVVLGMIMTALIGWVFGALGGLLSKAMFKSPALTNY